MENADLLTNAAAAIEWLREEVRLEETELTLHQTRLEVLREMLARLEGKPRRGRPPRVVKVSNLPLQTPSPWGDSGHAAINGDEPPEAA